MSTKQPATVRDRMLAEFTWITDDGESNRYVDTQNWWNDAAILGGVGSLLAAPFVSHSPTVVIGPPASGHLLGALVAAHLGTRLAAVEREPSRLADSDQWITATTAPDYRDRHTTFGLRKRIIGGGDRVLAVDDVAETGSQLLALQRLVEVSGATWLGASVTIDMVADAATRRKLGLKSIFHVRDLKG